MSSKAAEMLGHPPGIKFSPDDDELVEFFLLPRIRGEKAWFPGVVIINDDTAANTHPMELLERHGLAGDDNAYFFVRTRDAAARQDRHCAGGGRWVSQRPVSKGACIGGQEIKWRRVNLNLQTSRGKSGGGSNGWVMHEYTLTDPPCPFLKICHVTFSGHGKDSKRVPDGELAVSNKRARVAADSGSWKTTTIHDQESPSVVAHASCYGSGGSTTTMVEQDLYSATAQVDLTGGQEATKKWIDELLNDDALHGMAFAAPADAAEPCCFDGHVVQVAAPAEMQQVPEHFMARDAAGMAGLEDFIDTAFAAPVDAEHYCFDFEEQVVSHAAAPATEHFMPMLQETAGMAELDHPYLYRGEDQQEFLAPMVEAAVDEFGDVSSRMVVSYEGYEIELY